MPGEIDGLVARWGEWRIPTKRATNEVLAMFGCDRLTAGLQILRERPGYSSESLADNWHDEDSIKFQQIRTRRAERAARSEAKLARKHAIIAAEIEIEESKKRLEADLCAALTRHQHLAATYASSDRDFGDDYVVEMTVWSPCYRRARNAYSRQYQENKRAGLLPPGAQREREAALLREKRRHDWRWAPTWGVSVCAKCLRRSDHPSLSALSRAVCRPPTAA